MVIFSFNIKSGGNPPLKTDHGQGTCLGSITVVIMGILTGFMIGYNYNFHLSIDKSEKKCIFVN